MLGTSAATCSQISFLTEKTQDPQSRPAPVARQTCATVRAPASTAVATARSLTAAQWQKITAGSWQIRMAGLGKAYLG